MVFAINFFVSIYISHNCALASNAKIINFLLMSRNVLSMKNIFFNVHLFGLPWASDRQVDGEALPGGRVTGVGQRCPEPLESMGLYCVLIS